MTSTNEPVPILLIAFFFPPEMLTGSMRPHRFYKYLPEFGIQPWVLTGSEQDGKQPRVVQGPTPTRRPNKKTPRGMTEKAMRLWVFPSDDAVLWPLTAVPEAEKLLRSVPIKAIVSTFPPVNTHITAAVLNWRYKLPWIADFRDPLAGRPPGRGLSLLADSMVERIARKNASALITVTDVLLEEWKAAFPEHSGKMHLLWNGYDQEEIIAPLPVPPRTRRVICHAGSIYWDRDPAAVLRTLARLLENGRIRRGSITLRLVGGMDKIILPKNAAVIDKLRGYDAIEITGPMPRTQALQELCTADCLAIFDMTRRSAYALPAKIYEYVRVGRPILALTDYGSPIQRLLAKSGLHHAIISKDDPDERADAAMMEFLSMPTDPVSPSEWFTDTFDGRRQAGRLAELIKTAINGRS